jgi:iron complex outermembrane receptor protein
LRVIDNLTLTAGVEGLHDRFTSFPNAAISSPMEGGGTTYTTGSAVGNRLALAPDVTLSLGADYVVPLESRGDLTFSASYSYNDGFYGEPDNRLHQPSYNLANANVSWDSPAHLYKVRLWGKNLANAQYATSIGSQPNGDFIAYAYPRTYGATVLVNF